VAVETRLRAYNALEGNILQIQFKGIIFWYHVLLIPEESGGSRDAHNALEGNIFNMKFFVIIF